MRRFLFGDPPLLDHVPVQTDDDKLAKRNAARIKAAKKKMGTKYKLHPDNVIAIRKKA